MDGNLTIWDHAKRFLAFDCMTEEEIYQGLINENFHLWLFDNSACVTEKTDYNMLHILTAGGLLREAPQLLPTLEAFAKAMDCRGIELSGRRGWFRVLSKFGYLPQGQKLVKYFA